MTKLTKKDSKSQVKTTNPVALNPALKLVDDLVDEAESLALVKDEQNILTDNPNKRRGRIPNSVSRAATMQILYTSAPYAARYLRDVSQQRVAANNVRVDASKYIINQVVGMAIQKTEIVKDQSTTINSITINANDVAGAVVELNKAGIALTQAKNDALLAVSGTELLAIDMKHDE